MRYYNADSIRHLALSLLGCEVGIASPLNINTFNIYSKQTRDAALMLVDNIHMGTVLLNTSIQ